MNVLGSVRTACGLQRLGFTSGGTSEWVPNMGLQVQSLKTNTHYSRVVSLVQHPDCFGSAQRGQNNIE